MDLRHQRFLLVLKAALKGEKAAGQEALSVKDWQQLFWMAEQHNVLPMFFEAVYQLPVFHGENAAFVTRVKQRVVHQVMLQTIKTDEFLKLNQYLQHTGVRPLVVKGIVCRELYGKPDHRISSDEDLLISAEQFAACHEALQACGMKLAKATSDLERDYEIPYRKDGSPLYIELHKHLFPPESTAYGDLNGFFEDVFQRAIEEKIQGVSVLTMGHTDHLFYLICHAFKHFLHSGFGIRQVCDIVLYANKYGRDIDWMEILAHCQEIHADLFTAALFKIGETYLGFDPERACYPQAWRAMEVDEDELLEDLLSGGIYGASDMSRKHSSNITLNAVTAQKRGDKSHNHLLRTVFPSAQNMKNRYRYLDRYPFLLPVAWIDRVWKYRKELKNGTNNSAAESIRIGSRRIDLMKKYGILERKQ